MHILESPQGGRRVLLSERMVRDLRTLAIEGLLALPRRGVEVGGLLFGDPNARELRLTAFEEAPCEHRYGPSYALSEGDRAKLRNLLAENRARQMPLAGFFRSFTSRKPVIDAADQELVREQIPAGLAVWLMLQPLSAENCVARLRFFRDGQLLPELSEPPVPFDSRFMPTVELSPEATAVEPASRPSAFRSAPEPEPPRMELPTPAPQELSPWPGPDVPDTHAESAPIGVRWGLVAAICLLSVLAGGLAAKLWIVARSERWAELHLDARPTGGHVEVTWDAAAPNALSANKGLLAVTDGDTQYDIPLDKAQLLQGKYAYTPSHGELGVRLIVYANGRGAAGDSVRLAMVPVESAKREIPLRADAEQSTHAKALPASPPAPATREEKPVTGVAVPPSSVHEVQPQIPEGIRSRMSGEVVVPVEVQVNDRGQVVRAVSKAKTKDSVGRYLAEQAQKAAREWRFTPARTAKGEDVTASKTLRFVFTP